MAASEPGARGVNNPKHDRFSWVEANENGVVEPRRSVIPVPRFIGIGSRLLWDDKPAIKSRLIFVRPRRAIAKGTSWGSIPSQVVSETILYSTSRSAVAISDQATALAARMAKRHVPGARRRAPVRDIAVAKCNASASSTFDNGVDPSMICNSVLCRPMAGRALCNPPERGIVHAIADAARGLTWITACRCFGRPDPMTMLCHRDVPTSGHPSYR